MAKPTVGVAYGNMTESEKAALEVDEATGLRIVARACNAGVVWLAFEDGTEAVRDADGNSAEWG